MSVGGREGRGQLSLREGGGDECRWREGRGQLSLREGERVCMDGGRGEGSCHCEGGGEGMSLDGGRGQL